MTTFLMINRTLLPLAAALALGAATPALGGTTMARTGINFGTSVRALGNTSDATPDDGSGRSSKTQASGSLVNPYIGYAWTSINLGVMYTSESSTTHTTDVSTDGMTTTDRQASTSVRGTSLFARFMFASYFYFEGGLGLFDQAQTIATETKVSAGGNAFSGSSDTYTVNGVGPGGHAGGGVELPVKNGFFFTAAYQVRILQLRNGVNGNSLGHQGSVNQKQEALFGIAYYDK